MKKTISFGLRRFCFLSLTFIVSINSWAGNHREFQSGKLLDVSSEERLFEGTTIKRAVYQVQVGDVVYLARGERLNRHSGDPGHGLIVGDAVQAAIDGDNLILQRPDGKEIKARIFKRQRADAK